MRRQLGHYRLLRPLGRGQGGTVFLAKDERHGQAVAVKVLTRADDGRVGRAAVDDGRAWPREVAALQRLRHPHVVKILDAGHDDQSAWIVMELLPGADLQRYTQSSRLLPVPVVLRIGLRLAHALTHVHEAGVVHRDLKPSNVMVHWPADDLKLTDFGLSGVLGAQVTRTGVVLGSPAYLAPEQLAGAAPDAAGDLYALGITLYELLSGQLPFRAGQLGELLQRVAHEPPPDLRRLCPELPASAADLVMQLLAKRPHQRPTSAADVAEALRGWASPPGSVAPGAGPKSHPG